MVFGYIPYSTVLGPLGIQDMSTNRHCRLNNIHLFTEVAYVDTSIHLQLHFRSARICMCVCIYLYVCTFVYVYKYLYIYMHIYIYIYMHFYTRMFIAHVECVPIID